MARFLSIVFMTTVVAATSLVQAADNASLTGNYKVSAFAQGQLVAFWIFKFDAKDGKPTVELVATPERGIKADSIDDLKIKGNQISFLIKTKDRDFTFDGVIPKEKGKAVKGCLSFGRQALPAELEPTKLREFNDFEFQREAFVNKEGLEVFGLALALANEAAKNKIDAKEVKTWVDKAMKTAEPYGPIWQREVASRFANILAKHDQYAAVAVEIARHAERTLHDGDDPATQLRILETLVSAMKKENKDADVKELSARIEKLEAKADRDYLKKMPPFKVDVYAGRKEDTNKVTLVELFTGAECPPCVACDVAFDALEQAFKPGEVVLLQYHLNIPRPDPLTAPVCNDRFKYYSGEGTPTFAINGKVAELQGGGLPAAEKRYGSLREIIDPQIDKKTSVHLKATAIRKGDKVEIKADVEGIEAPGEKMRLRICLVEEAVRYVGSNALRFHHRVVRAMPGGANGIEIKEKTLKQTETVDLKELREQLHKYLNEVAKDDVFPNDKRPMDFKKLSVVCFVQDDAKKEVLQAIQVNVKDE